MHTHKMEIVSCAVSIQTKKRGKNTAHTHSDDDEMRFIDAQRRKTYNGKITTTFHHHFRHHRREHTHKHTIIANVILITMCVMCAYLFYDIFAVRHLIFTVFCAKLVCLCARTRTWLHHVFIPQFNG